MCARQKASEDVMMSLLMGCWYVGVSLWMSQDPPCTPDEGSIDSKQYPVVAVVYIVIWISILRWLKWRSRLWNIFRSLGETQATLSRSSSSSNSSGSGVIVVETKKLTLGLPCVWHHSSSHSLIVKYAGVCKCDQMFPFLSTLFLIVNPAGVCDEAKRKSILQLTLNPVLAWRRQAGTQTGSHIGNPISNLPLVE